MPSTVTVTYFPIRGRGEAIKLALASQGVEFEAIDVDTTAMRSDMDAYHFYQVPRYVDDEVSAVQQNAILRHLARKYSLYGDTLAESVLVDEILDCVYDLRRVYLKLIYEDELNETAKSEYVEKHFNPASAAAPFSNGGAHFAFLNRILLKNNKGKGFVVGDKLSIADIVLFDILDLHYRVFPEELSKEYPEFVEYKDRIASNPGISAYLQSPKRLPKANGNGLGS